MDDDPACDITGICEAAVFIKGDTVGMCIHCGAEMFKEKGRWFHHSQEEIPYDMRWQKHDGPE